MLSCTAEISSYIWNKLVYLLWNKSCGSFELYHSKAGRGWSNLHIGKPHWEPESICQSLAPPTAADVSRSSLRWELSATKVGVIWEWLVGSALWVSSWVCFLYRLWGTDCSPAVQYVPPPQVYWDTTWISSPVSNHHLLHFKTTGKPFVRRFLVIRLIQRSGNFGFPTAFSSLTACDGRSSTKVWLTAHSTPSHFWLHM